MGKVFSSPMITGLVVVLFLLFFLWEKTQRDEPRGITPLVLAEMNRELTATQDKLRKGKKELARLAGKKTALDREVRELAATAKQRRRKAAASQRAAQERYERATRQTQELTQEAAQLVGRVEWLRQEESRIQRQYTQKNARIATQQREVIAAAERLQRLQAEEQRLTHRLQQLRLKVGFGDGSFR